MTVLRLAIFLLFCCIAYPAAFQAQAVAGKDTDAVVPVMAVDDAVSIALANNRLIKNASLEAEKYEFRISSTRSRRLPELNISVLQSELLNPVDFTFLRGVFGVFPGIGPVPGVDTKIRTPARLNTLAMGSINQPLTQQYRIGLGLQAQKLGREISREDMRAMRQKIANEVRAAYFTLVATQSGLEAARQSVKMLQEVQLITQRYEAEQTVLKGDLLQVQARLAKQQYQLAVANNAIAIQSEHLNQLLGRDLSTGFRVKGIPEENDGELTLELARRRAVENRPEMRQALLKDRQAEYDRRIAKAAYIPDVSLIVGYLGIRSIELVPSNAAAAGLFLSWEPFDWGRRRDVIAEKSKTVEQARNGGKETESQIAVEVGMHFRKWQEAGLLLKASRAAQEAATEQFRVTTNKFKEQAALVKDVLQAEAQSADADFQYQQALSQYWNALADLRKSMGEE
jgi:outer membrane protein